MNENIETDAIEKTIDALNAMSRLEFQRAYMGAWEMRKRGPKIGAPVYYNDKGQLIYEDGERVLKDE